MQRQQTLWVINTNVDPHHDRFNGEDFFFPYHVPVEIPVEGAQLMFGYGEDSKVSTLMRSGKCPTSRDLPEGLKWLANFSFYGSEQEAHAANTPGAEADHQFAPVVENSGGAKAVAVPPDVAQAKVPPKLAKA